MPSYLFATLLLLAQSYAAFAAEILGTVTDPSGRAAPGARLLLEPNKHEVLSGPGGEFCFAGVSPGEYSLTAESDAFEPVTLKGLRATGAETLRVTLAFREVRASRVQVDVIGAEPETALQHIPGSAFLIDARMLAESRPADANEILRQTPGLHVREDSGPAAMRLNIGVRGLNPDRSRTLLVLEDGLPVALAPYGEPELYYSPPIDRMNRVEVLKGSGSIAYGPQTIGGVLNFITPDPPLRPQGAVELSGGEWGAFKTQASYGGSRGPWAWHVNALRKQGDGWRDLHFGINDVTSKLNYSPSDRRRFGLKVGVYGENSNSTYLGLTEPMFRANPNANPVPHDLLTVNRFAASLTHQFVLSPRALLSASAFGYTTTRNWRRQDFDRAPRAGMRYLGVAGDPSVPGGAIYLRDSAANNNREFDVAGAESRYSREFEWLGVRQRLETGARYLREEHRDARIDGARFDALTGTVRENELRHGHAASGFLQNRLFLGPRFTLTPGVRLEDYRYRRHILRQPVSGVPSDVNVRRGGRVTKPIPGIGAAFQATAPLTLFAGVHRGFAPPRIKDAITREGASLELDAELSWNYEAGARLSLARGVRAEATYFATGFSNQIVPATQSGGAASTLINAGRTLHRGAEFLIATDWSRLLGLRDGLRIDLRHTWLARAEFRSGIFDGNRLPYAPRHAYGLRANYRHRKGLSLHLDGSRVGEQFGDNRETRLPSADGTIGPLPAYWVWNASAGQAFRRERFTFEPFVCVKNLADARYISSRAPQGIQPGMFRGVSGGVKFGF